MGGVAIAVVVVLLIMSVYLIAMWPTLSHLLRGEKAVAEFAPRVAQALKNDRIEEAINISDKHRKSHLAMVVSSGLQEFRAHEASSDISGDEIEASKRALQRAIAIKTAEFVAASQVWRRSVPPLRSWACSERCSASSTLSGA